MLRNAVLHRHRFIGPPRAGGDWWSRAVCADDSRWFADDSATRAVARHICVRHCPVLKECWAETMAEVRRGVRPCGCVRGGLNWNDAGRAERSRQTTAARCDRCPGRRLTADDIIRAERDIQTYRALKEAGSPLERPHYRETLLLLAAGASDLEIAHETGYSVHAIKSRIKVIIRELDARDRHHAAAVARQRGLIRLGD